MNILSRDKQIEVIAALAEGMAIDGVLYGAIEATVDRVQGGNAWLMLGLREGRDRKSVV